MANTHTFSKGEEIANSISHGVAALLSVAALVILIALSTVHGNAWQIVSFTVFGTTMLLLYTCSTLVHALPPGKAKDIFEILDHSAIYFFIAGSYTPYLFLVIKGWESWTLFGVVWGLAIIGTVLKCFFVKKFLVTSTILYVIMGWLIVIVWDPITSAIQPEGIILLVSGGIFYTIGSVFYVWRGFRYHHAIWHIFVIAGSAAHFFAVLWYLI
ncbi:PAQR family membrane homeostasis protein TrhA [Neobacillus massiliamazoniensis]|uniref:Putative hemolysin III family channel protein n=1 Tax=Neobacillus massiliamazoniensis TaxID=1499688 RepID=A0A0U1NY41_9BACI|nr:hemolysin III family protein [Neobacillus massiliamazoniensis]CRK82896.1 putative hemolysin III family channel protein [Neobacillus massiliamazoniensis]